MDTFGEFQKERSAYTFSNEPLIFQSNEYLCLFQKSIEGLRKYVDADSILITSGQEVAYNQFSKYFKVHSKFNPRERKKIVEDYFMSCGFGKINLRTLHAKGGYVEAQHNPFAKTYREMYGDRPENEPGVSYFILGFLCGVTEAVFGIKPGTFDGRQSKCFTKGDSNCRFEIFRGKKKTLKGSPGEGSAQVIETASEETGAVDFDKVMDYWLKLPLKGSSDNGIIEAFGQTLTLHYANYFCLVAIKVLIDIEKKVGRKGVGLARTKIIDAANFGAVKLVSGIIQSEEWKSEVAPMIKHKDDTLYGVLATMVALGWGHWKVETLSENGETTFQVNGGFESNAYEKLIGNVKEPVSYFVYGSSLGVMNTIYNAELNGSVKADQEFFESVSKGDNKYTIKAIKTRLTGNGADVVTVGR